jgi:hypothetical protein
MPLVGGAVGAVHGMAIVIGVIAAPTDVADQDVSGIGGDERAKPDRRKPANYPRGRCIRAIATANSSHSRVPRDLRGKPCRHMAAGMPDMMVEAMHWKTGPLPRAPTQSSPAPLARR